MNLRPLLRQYAWNLAYARALTADVDEDHWARSGGPGLENHPAWTLGHLVTGSALVVEDLGGKANVPAGWRDLFERRGPSDPRRPDTDATQYPPKAAVLEELARQHAMVAQRLGDISEAWSGTTVEWRFDGYLPTNADMTLFMLVAHENVHLGQLGCWRRRFELPSAMAAMPRGP